MNLKRTPLFGALLLSIVGGCNQPATVEPTSVAQNSAAPPSAQIDRKTQAFVRGLHVVPGAGPLALTSKKADADEKVTDINNITFESASDFVALSEGKYKFYVEGSDGKSKAGPMPVFLDSGEDMTIVANGVPGDIALLPFKHKNGGAQAGQAKVAFLHAAKSLPGVDVLIDGKSYRRDIKYGIATDYKTLPPGRHTMQISYRRNAESKTVIIEQSAPTPAVAENSLSENIVTPAETPISTEVRIPQKQTVSLAQPLDLSAGKVYSVVVFQDASDLPKLRLLEDKFAAELKSAPSP